MIPWYDMTMRHIPLTRGKVALVDESDYERVSSFKWFACKPSPRGCWYAARNEPGQIRTYMHRFILGVSSQKIKTDHIDGNGLNNQRSNIRECTQLQNLRNKRGRISATSEFKGVCLYKGRWIAQIKYGGKNRVLGRFDSEIMAAKAYDAAATKAFGDFACVNFKKDESQ